MRWNKGFSRWIAGACIPFIILSLWYFQHDRTPSIPVTKSSFDWSTLKVHHPFPSTTSLPSGQPRRLPRIQHKFGHESRAAASIQQKRRDTVRRAFTRCWESYKKYAWMQDELLPVSATSRNNYAGWAATLVDSLDTLWIMGLEEEFHEAVRAVAVIDWNTTPETACNVFETTIRHLGGLLSAYDLSGHPTLLQKAAELGDMLYMAFDTPSGLPPFWLNFEKAKTGGLVAGDHEPSASSATLSMEFTRLSQLTHNPKYYNAISRVTNLMDRAQNKTKLPGMWPAFWDLRNKDLTDDNSFTLGALADSIYEYLPKMYALLGGLGPVYEKMYKDAASTIKDNLLFRPMIPDNNDILFSGSASVDNHKVHLNPEGQHLACFIGGMYGLGGKLFGLQEHVDLGMKLTNGCIWAYRSFRTGIMPEYFNMAICDTLDGCSWDEKRWRRELAADEHGSARLPQGFTNARVPSYSLRPEAIESVFLLYRMTGHEGLRDAAWDMFESIQKATSTAYCNAAIDDVNSNAPRQTDSMESFWLAETLKYFYLIFSPPDLIDLDEWVLNTEAHPFRIPR
ncbi:hypothetical protein A1O3_07764 [Capronia epimyces CBS 606.96]|uniref:alpha-1,2-Mannosidase n=1 Tax=Capronia epimyces CBS 606.96 TaxID=1182542 RepID=W9XLS9_9EURO|nr:uncharacterized protein A1O3_07764 [Capronia epimyces CBS 606.96]EXJ81472.1 hypothetical protein A1O3_07764 [Capronia epimyces CBS 606.96]